MRMARTYQYKKGLFGHKILNRGRLKHSKGHIRGGGGALGRCGDVIRKKKLKKIE